MKKYVAIDKYEINKKSKTRVVSSYKIVSNLALIFLFVVRKLGRSFVSIYIKHSKLAH